MTALERQYALAATLPGELLYRALGFTVTERFSVELPDGAKVPVRHMSQTLVEP